MNVGIKVPSAWFREIMNDLQKTEPYEVLKEGMTLLCWVISERKKGRVILSSDPDGTNINRLVTKCLEQIKPE